MPKPSTAHYKTNTNGDGSVSYIAYIQYTDLTGKRRTKSISCATLEEQQAAGLLLEQTYGSDRAKMLALKGQRLLRDWVPIWGASKAKMVKQRSIEAFLTRLENWVVPYLGHYTLLELERDVINEWINFEPGLAHLGHGSKQMALDALKNCLSGAVDDNAIPYNPAFRIKIGRSVALTKRDRQQKHRKIQESIWTPDEALVLLTGSEGTKIEALVTMGLLAGLRPGEVYGLVVEDFNILTGWLGIQRNLTEGEKTSVILEDSTKNGLWRDIKLDFEIVKRMQVLSDRQAGMRGYGKGYKLVAEVGEPLCTLSPSRHRELLDELCGTLGIPSHSPKQLRHTFASLAHSAGAPMAAISTVMGHSLDSMVRELTGNPMVTPITATYIQGVESDVHNVTSLVVRLLLQHVAPQVRGGVLDALPEPA